MVGADDIQLRSVDCGNPFREKYTQSKVYTKALGRSFEK